MVAANVLFAAMAISARLASRSASWTTVGASRALVGAAVAFAFALRSGASLRTRNRGLAWARSISGTLAMLATFYALGSPNLAVGDAATIFATAPILIALFSPWLLGEKASRGLWGVLLVAFAGVALVAGPQLSFSGLPACASMLSAVFSALAMMFLRRMRSGHGSGEPESTEAIALHFALVAFAAHAIFGLFSFRMPTARDAGWLFLTGFTGGLAQLAMTRAYALTEAARLGAVSYLNTVVTFLAGIVFLGERPAWTQLAGCALVVSAGLALAVSAARRARGSASSRQRG